MTTNLSPRGARSRSPRRVATQAASARGDQAIRWHSASASRMHRPLANLRTLSIFLASVVVVVAVALILAGFAVEGVQPPLEKSDAVIVISGDEDLARLREGIHLWREGWAPVLVFSGAAREGPISNAEAMRRLAIDQGVPAAAILLDEQGEDTYGNAVFTRRLLEQHELQSAILVTSPYHLQRASMTFKGVYQGSGIQVIANAAPDSDWRKRSWWLRHDLRLLTLRELEKIGYILITGRYN